MKPLTQSGYIALIGRPNVGKSTVLNALVGQKVSIISRKPQTTRTQMLGITHHGTVEAIYIDTPGIHQAEKRTMNRYMNRLATSVILDADVIVFIIDARGLKLEDELILKKLTSVTSPVLLVLNKIDLLKDKNQLLPLISELQLIYSFKEIIPISARKKTDVERLRNIIFHCLPQGEHLFHKNQVTDKNTRFQIAELIREKCIHMTGQELPYSLTVVTESMEPKGKLMHISAVIWVEREGQKPILIGKGGERIKKIGTLARKDIEKLLEKKVYLDLRVKVKSDWTNNENFLNSLGLRPL